MQRHRLMRLALILLLSTTPVAPMGGDPPARETLRIGTSPGADWDTLKGALSDGKLDAGDVIDVSVAAVWSAIGNRIGDARMCRLAQLAALGPPPRTFSVDVSITSGDESVSYEQSYLVTYTPTAVLYAPIRGRDPAGNFLTGQPVKVCPKPSGLGDWPPESQGQRGSMTQDPTGAFLGLGWETEYGKVRVILPDDMRAGDTITGTVMVEPAGATPQEQQGNVARLSGYVVDVEGRRTRVSEGRIAMFIGIAATGLGLSLRDAANVPLGAARIPVGTVAGAGSGAGIPTEQVSFNFSRVPFAASPAGVPLEITGPFDGNASNTNVSLNGQAGRVLAESPRQVVIECPPGQTGPVEIAATDNGRTTTTQTNLVGVLLSAPKTRLLRGERTELTLQVAGLQGLTEQLNITLTASPNVRLAGGNNQTVRINPRRADANGVHTSRYRLQSTVPGEFEVTARYVVQHEIGTVIWY